MSHDLDREFWEAHWQNVVEGAEAGLPPHPALISELSDLEPGSALDAGSGEGAEAIWLAERGWKVIAADISANAIARATRRPGADAVTWVEADLSLWEPVGKFDLVATLYAHPAMAQDAFYERISRWVAPGGTLLIVGHHHQHGLARGHHVNAVTAPEEIRATLDPAEWTIHVAETRERVVSAAHGHTGTLRDVIVLARRTRAGQDH
jgi:SAM-dependent methyltransferase